MKEKILKAFGENVRSIRIKRGYSQEKLAELSKCHPNYIGFIERGKRAATIVKTAYIAKALECKIADLFKDFP